MAKSQVEGDGSAHVGTSDFNYPGSGWGEEWDGVGEVVFPVSADSLSTVGGVSLGLEGSSVVFSSEGDVTESLRRRPGTSESEVSVASLSNWVWVDGSTRDVPVSTTSTEIGLEVINEEVVEKVLNNLDLGEVLWLDDEVKGGGRNSEGSESESLEHFFLN